MSEAQNASTDTGFHMEALCKLIQEESAADVSRLNADAEAAAAAVLEQLNGRVAEIQDPILNLAQANADAYLMEKHAEEDLAARHDWLLAREAMLNELFAKLEDSLQALSQSNAYARALPQWLKEAAAALKEDELILEADSSSREILEGAALTSLEAEGMTRFIWGEDWPEGKRHGFILSSTNGRRRFECTLESRLEQLKPAMRARALQILTGGQDA